MIEPSFCGCCGREVRDDLLWCNDCMSHLLADRDASDHYVPLWDRTWFAQHGTDCPFTDDCMVCHPAPLPPPTPGLTSIRLRGTRHRSGCSVLPSLSAEEAARLSADLRAIDEAIREGHRRSHDCFIGSRYPQVPTATEEPS